MPIQRHSVEAPCPICEGHGKMPSGQGIRCFGFSTDDGWVLCTREGEGTRAPYKTEAQGWSHKVMGMCPCGVVHKDDPEYLARRETRGLSASKEQKTVVSIGEAKRAKIVQTYTYCSKRGDTLYEVCRMEPKSFRQRRPHPHESGKWLWKMKAHDGFPEQQTTLYQIPELFAALAAGDTIFVVEGERDVESLRDAQRVATCNTGGAGKWRDALAEPFKSAQPNSEIIVVQDKDGPGEKHARQVYDSILSVIHETVSIRIVESVEGKDATDHLQAGRSVEEFALVWPVSEKMLSTSPAIFKRNILRQAIIMPESALQEAIDGEVAESPPPFKSPLRGDKEIERLQGVVTLAGAPSSGKSYFAIGCGIDNALDKENPWDVYYLNCEMGADYVIDRALRAASSSSMTAYECRDHKAREDAAEWARDTPMPGRFTRVDVGIGVTMAEVIEYLAEAVTDSPTLVILDSISSFCDNMDEIMGDSFGMSNLRTVQKYATAVRRLTKGHVSWLILSELNKEGRAKGRSLDHRSDMAISMRPDPDQGHIKRLDVTKSWFGPTGPLGDFILHPDIARLVRGEFD